MECIYDENDATTRRSEIINEIEVLCKTNSTIKGDRLSANYLPSLSTDILCFSKYFPL